MTDGRPPSPVAYGCLIAVILAVVALAGLAVIFLWDVNVKS